MLSLSLLSLFCAGLISLSVPSILLCSSLSPSPVSSSSSSSSDWSLVASFNPTGEYDDLYSFQQLTMSEGSLMAFNYYSSIILQTTDGWQTNAPVTSFPNITSTPGIYNYAEDLYIFPSSSSPSSSPSFSHALYGAESQWCMPSAYTTDGGASMQPSRVLSSPPGLNFSYCTFGTVSSVVPLISANPLSVAVYGTSSNLEDGTSLPYMFVSDDGGQTLNAAQIPSFPSMWAYGLQLAAMPSPSTWYMGFIYNDPLSMFTGPCVYFQTTNAGADWAQVLSVPNCTYAGALECWDESHCAVLVQTEIPNQSAVMYTDDGGSTWSTVLSLSSDEQRDSLLGLQLLNSKQWIVVGGTLVGLDNANNTHYGYVYTTSSGGSEWTREVVEGICFYGVSMISADEGYAVGENGAAGSYLYSYQNSKQKRMEGEREMSKTAQRRAGRSMRRRRKEGQRRRRTTARLNDVSSAGRRH